VRFKDFIRALADAKLRRREPPALPARTNGQPFQPVAGAKITIKRFFEKVNSFLKDNTIVVTDVGDSLFGAADLCIHQNTEFLGPAYYASMGFAVPAAIGAGIANPALRPLVLVGDGAFQMTGMELSAAVRYGLSPIVVVLNNRGYGTERHMQDGPYNDVLEWQYSRIPDLLGSGKGFIVETEDQLEEALAAAEANTKSLSIIDLRLELLDRSPALERLASRLAKRL
jgi:indolepyruvate decarboxylase